MKREVRVFIEGQQIDLFNDETIEVNSSVQNIADISKTSTDFSQAFTIPATPRNNAIFQHFYQSDVDGTYNFQERKDGYIEIDMTTFRRGRIQLEKSNVKNGQVENYTITFYGQLTSLKDIFGEDKLSDLESSARFYVEENGEIHLHSDFLLDKEDVSHNVVVAFILYNDILFSIRKEELPVFRLQRLRALSQANYVSDSRDMLLDLYAANAEYSSDALEDVYRALEIVGNHVLSKPMSDEEATKILIDIANEEDLNGRIRRNVMDTRRAVSVLMRSKLLQKDQLEYSRQILLDIESLDGHTAFLFDKINFLMDAVVGFININQNKVVKRLTVVSVVFMPLNVLAGIGGMSEFSMMTEGISWPVSYSVFTVGLVIVGWFTYAILRFLENLEHVKKSKR